MICVAKIKRTYGDVTCGRYTPRADNLCGYHKPRVYGNAPQPHRSVTPTYPDYRLCALCGLVWNIGQDFCPSWLRSRAEDRMLAALRRKSA